MVNKIFKILALYNTPTWENYVAGLLPEMKSKNEEIYHILNGLLALHKENALDFKLLRKTILDLCNDINPQGGGDDHRLR